MTFIRMQPVLKDNDLVVFSIGKINDLWWVISCTSGGLTNVKWTWKYPHKKNLKARRISRASVLTNAWPQKELYLRQNVPKRCLSVRLCNIHQSWILMSSLTEKGMESILLRNKNTQKKTSTDVSDRPCQAQNFLPMWADVNLDVRLSECST